MHTRMSTTDLLWWVVIIGLQACLAISNRHTLSSLRAFLVAESILSATLLAVAKIANPWHYFYSWIAGTVIHHGLCAFLMWSLFAVIRSRGLPTRQNRWPIALLGIVSLAAGIYFAIAAYGIIEPGAFRMVVPLDHGVAFSIGCMMAGLPFYMVYVSARIPRSLHMALAGFAIYEFAYAGLAGAVISAHPRMLNHAVDLVYLLSLFLWSKSLYSIRPLEAAEPLSLLT